MVKEKENVVVKFRGGGSIVALPPVFSEDSSRIYLAWKNVVVCYNARTAVRILEYNGLEHPIIGFGCTILNSEEVVCACTAHGVVRVWQASTGYTLAKFKSKLHVCYFKLLVDDSTHVPKAFIAITEKNYYKFAKMDLETGEIVRQKLNIKRKNKKICFDTCSNGKYYVIVQGNKLYYHRFDTLKIHRYSISKRFFTCVLCHPVLDCVITGDNTGRVIVWHDLCNNATQAIFHWHTNPVQSISFSNDGTYFFSGGSECVLVKWEMDNNIHKQFLPRLPSTINQISVSTDNSLIAVATLDNAVQIVDFRLNYVNVIQHLVLGNNYSAGLIYDPRSKAVVLNGVVGHLQFYYPKDLSLLYNLDVICQNKFTDERKVKIINTVITKTAIDKTGLWMATIERRDDPDFPEQRLKFWLFDTAQQNFTLNTCVEEPHKNTVSNIIFQPTCEKYGAMCITAGKDNKFKIWKVVCVSTAYFEGLSWQCMNVIFYRDLTPNAMAFATDGSLLAVAFDSTVTTWLPNSCELKCSLQHPSCQDNLIHVSFGVGPQCHLLVSATPKLINVWNLLTLSLTWMVYIDVSVIISDPVASFKAVFTKDKKIYVFEPKSANPVYFSDKCLKNVAEIKAATFVPRPYNSDVHLNWYHSSQIYFIDSNQEMYSLEKNEKITNAELIYDETPNSLFSYLLPKIKSGANSTFKVTHLYTKDDKSSKLKELLNIPAHTMAPLHLTAEDILHSMILENKKIETEKDAKSEEHVPENKFRRRSRTFTLTDESNLDSLSKVDLNSTSWVSVF